MRVIDEPDESDEKEVQLLLEFSIYWFLSECLANEEIRGVLLLSSTFFLALRIDFEDFSLRVSWRLEVKDLMEILGV